MTARDVKFSEAMSSIPSFCRAVSAATMRAISGSASARVRFRSDAGRTAVDMGPPRRKILSSGHSARVISKRDPLPVALSFTTP